MGSKEKEKQVTVSVTLEIVASLIGVMRQRS